MIGLLIKLIKNGGIVCIIGVILSYIGLEKLGDIVAILGLVGMFLCLFRSLLWDYRKTALKMMNFFIERTGSQSSGIILGSLTFFLLLVTICGVKPSSNFDGTYRYKQIEYEVGDTVTYGTNKFIANGLKNAEVISIEKAVHTDGSPDLNFFEDVYTLSDGKIIYRSQVFGIREDMHGLLWIPKSYYYGAKYLLSCFFHFIKFLFC